MADQPDTTDKQDDFKALLDAIDLVLDFIPSFKRDQLKVALVRLWSQRESQVND